MLILQVASSSLFSPSLLYLFTAGFWIFHFRVTLLMKYCIVYQTSILFKITTHSKTSTYIHVNMLTPPETPNYCFNTQDLSLLFLHRKYRKLTQVKLDSFLHDNDVRDLYTSNISIDNHLSAKTCFNNTYIQLLCYPKHKLQFKTLLQISFHTDTELKGSKHPLKNSPQ